MDVSEEEEGDCTTRVGSEYCHPSASVPSWLLEFWETLTAKQSDTVLPVNAVAARQDICGTRVESATKEDGITVLLAVGTVEGNAAIEALRASAAGGGTLDYGGSLCAGFPRRWKAGCRKRTSFLAAGPHEIASLCSQLLSLSYPGVLSLSAPYFFDQCSGWGAEVGTIRLVTFLRNPADRARATFTDLAVRCACATTPSDMCKAALGESLLSDIRDGRAALRCDDEGRPSTSFWQAVLDLRSRPAVRADCEAAAGDFMSASAACSLWPLLRADTSESLPAHMALAIVVLTNRYVESFGLASEGIPRLSAFSARLADATLQSCFAFVGIHEDFELSVSMLRHDVPQPFSSLPTDAASILAPLNLHSEYSNATAEAEARVVLSTDYLSSDFALYNRARHRLYDRASSLGFAVSFPPTIATTGAFFEEDAALLPLVSLRDNLAIALLLLLSVGSIRALREWRRRKTLLARLTLAQGMTNHRSTTD